ncbi:MAG: hypothetical protein QM783_08160 [Phycisphaerales bacterium]
MLGRISLANKCLLLFGLAVVMIIVAALSVPWVRMNQLVDESELAVSRSILATWEAAERRPVAHQPDPGLSPLTRPGLTAGERLNVGDARVAVYDKTQAEKSAFAMRAWAKLVVQPAKGASELVEVDRTLFQRDYRVARRCAEACRWPRRRRAIRRPRMRSWCSSGRASRPGGRC